MADAAGAVGVDHPAVDYAQVVDADPGQHGEVARDSGAGRVARQVALWRRSRPYRRGGSIELVEDAVDARQRPARRPAGAPGAISFEQDLRAFQGQAGDPHGAAEQRVPGEREIDAARPGEFHAVRPCLAGQADVLRFQAEVGQQGDRHRPVETQPPAGRRLDLFDHARLDRVPGQQERHDEGRRGDDERDGAQSDQQSLHPVLRGSNRPQFRTKRVNTVTRK
ncbi:hypothetical protein SL003B_0418 [Polymorphum gilvum SL003B-26A1]|uniref:Uncharacterized protein n=1 Tax=Polymorphum gilvum (strain LMG 25793 / CGMCC 1.9160 / SL003B-26A1) TaxID=991905 RepID=F2J2Y3_POLGS|nr:hypothetical protein [Polymorphum gilvum]ADZ68853.1 hypothetical protein SL003B_0418 [Polymorphum gilvum SL003B-26A1]